MSRGGKNKFVVLVTAPTGHTLLLRDSTGSYHREVARQMGTTMHVVPPGCRKTCVVPASNRGPGS
ncbi:hypothetical protein [Cryobacterium adonitolivorans]|uniref:hypothetical protein n=1 Tax=Cryobacterium adonitolivorans TaxID=1259189 RepID=UPI003B97BCFA